MNASDLITAALDELLATGTKLSDILLKIKAIGHFIGNAELKAWASLELNGYHGSDATIPAYRRIGVVPRVNLVKQTFSHVIQQSNQPMVVEYMDNDIQDALTHRYIGQSVPEIEHLAEQDGNPRIDIPQPIYAMVSKKTYERSDWYIQNAWHVVPVNHLTALLAVIRSKLVDLLLELDQLDKDVSLQTLKGKQAATETVSKALNSTITVGAGGIVNYSAGDGAVQAANSGNAAQLNTAGDHATQSITPAQAASLRELVEQLKPAIAEEPSFDEHREEMEQEVERIEVQLQKPEPKKGIMKRAFESLQDLAVKSVGTATGHAVYELLKQAPDLIDSAM